jgi:ABC-type lipoprotein export system ATPase subunit
MSEVIEMRNVCFSAQEGKIVHDISVEFKTSKTTAIVGPSGGGKSTMLKLAAGILVPDPGGEVVYKDQNVTRMNRAENLQYRRECAFVFQDSALWANQNLYQILELPLKIHYPEMDKIQRDKKIRAMAELVGYRKDLNIRPSRLSMGEQKLIAFARAMLCSPSVLFLDEWTESVDESAAENLVDIVRRMQRERATIIFVSHDMSLIMDLADYVIVLVDGKITARAPKDQIITDLLLKDFLKIGIAS